MAKRKRITTTTKHGEVTFLAPHRKKILLKQKFMGINKETLGKIVILADQGQKLSEALEDNNQELKILLHALVSEGKTKSKLKYHEHLLSLPKGKIKK